MTSPTPRYTITQQREAVEIFLDHVEHGGEAPGPMTRDAARQAVLTLGWLERRAELVREIERLDREAPQLVEILCTFPGTRIDGVR